MSKIATVSRGKKLLNLLAIYSLLFLNNTGMLMSPAMDTMVQAFPNEAYSKVLLISTLPSLVALPFILLSGNFAGTKIRYRTLALAAIPVFIFSGTAPYFLHSLNAVLVCRVIYGVCLGLIGPLCNALILRNYDGEDRIRYLGYGNVVLGLSGVVFQQVSGHLCLRGWNYVFLGHLLGLVPLLLIVVGLIEPEVPVSVGVTQTDAVPERKSFIQTFTRPGVLPLFLLVVSLYVCTQTKSLTISSIVKSEGMGDATTSATILSMSTMGALFGGLVFPMFCRRVKQYRVPTLIMVLSLMTVTNLMNSAALIGVGYGIGTMAYMMNLNLCTLRASRLFPKEETSRAVSLIQCADKLGVFMATFFTAFCSWLVQTLHINYSIYRAPIIATLIIYFILSLIDAIRSGPERDI